MSIKDLTEKIKPFYTLILILVIISIILALGRLSAIEGRKTPLKIEYIAENQAGMAIQGAISANQDTDTGVQTGVAPVVGSKTGKKYYFPWCGGLKRVKLENQIKFSSIEEAKNAGYSPAGNCKGLN